MSSLLRSILAQGKQLTNLLRSSPKSSRLFIAAADLPQFSIFLRELDASLVGFRETLKLHLAEHRKKSVMTGEAIDSPEDRRLFRVFALFVDFLDTMENEIWVETKAQEKSWFSKTPKTKVTLAKLSDKIDLRKHDAIELSEFDFTAGFKVMTKSSYQNGMAVVVNPITGDIHWLKELKSGLAITGFDENGAPLYARSWKTGISSAYDPVLQKWIPFNGGWKTPSASVFNPQTGKIETAIGGFNTGIAGVYNPLTREVEWHAKDGSGVSGYFDPEQKKIIWKTHYQGGCATIWRDEENKFHTSSGFFGGESDDDE